MSVSKLQLLRHAQGRVVHSTDPKRLQIELTVVRQQIRSLEELERRLAGALKEWDRSPRATPIGHSITRLIDPFPTDQ